jgi:hypothetical protein
VGWKISILLPLKENVSPHIDVDSVYNDDYNPWTYYSKARKGIMRDHPQDS